MWNCGPFSVAGTRRGLQREANKRGNESDSFHAAQQAQCGLGLHGWGCGFLGSLGVRCRKLAYFSPYECKRSIMDLSMPIPFLRKMVWSVALWVAALQVDSANGERLCGSAAWTPPGIKCFSMNGTLESGHIGPYSPGIDGHTSCARFCAWHWEIRLKDGLI